MKNLRVELCQTSIFLQPVGDEGWNSAFPVRLTFTCSLCCECVRCSCDEAESRRWPMICITPVTPLSSAVGRSKATPLFKASQCLFMQIYAKLRSLVRIGLCILGGKHRNFCHLNREAPSQLHSTLENVSKRQKSLQKRDQLLILSTYPRCCHPRITKRTLHCMICTKKSSWNPNLTLLKIDLAVW
jgi:hypothetical protein